MRCTASLPRVCCGCYGACWPLWLGKDGFTLGLCLLSLPCLCLWPGVRNYQLDFSMLRILCLLSFHVVPFSSLASVGGGIRPAWCHIPFCPCGLLGCHTLLSLWLCLKCFLWLAVAPVLVPLSPSASSCLVGLAVMEGCGNYLAVVLVGVLPAVAWMVFWAGSRAGWGLPRFLPCLFSSSVAISAACLVCTVCCLEHLFIGPLVYVRASSFHWGLVQVWFSDVLDVSCSCRYGLGLLSSVVGSCLSLVCCQGLSTALRVALLPSHSLHALVHMFFS